MTFILITALAFLPSCVTSGASCNEIVGEIAALSDVSGEAFRIYRSDAAPGTRSYMSERLSVLLYSGKGDSAPELPLASEWSVLLANSQCGYEIHAFRLRHLSDAAAVESMLYRRVSTLQNREIHLYIPYEYEKYIAQAVVYRRADCVFLLITGDNDAAIDIINKYVR